MGSLFLVILSPIFKEDECAWIKRLNSYSSAFQLLNSALQLTQPNDLEKDGIIHRFEFTHELAWKLMKDYLEYEGIVGITGSRSATREAFNKGLITDGQIWMDMIESRNKTVHTYLKEILISEYELITESYFPLLMAFGEKMKSYL